MIVRLAWGAGATSASAVEPLSQREHHWMRSAIRVGSAFIRIAHQCDGRTLVTVAFANTGRTRPFFAAQRYDSA
jgi:hypothetical protein